MRQYLDYMEKKWGNRIFSLLQRMEQPESDTENEAYKESLLSLEVKEYFSFLARQKPILDTKEEKASFMYPLYTVFALDDFEKMCVELAVLGEINPFFEKFFIYMSNDWNGGYLTFDTAVRLYTLEWETKPEFYRYFEEDGKLASYFLHVCSSSEKSRVRWGLRCRNAFFSFLFSGRPSAGTKEEIAEWHMGQSCEGVKTEAGEMPVFSKLDQIFTLADGALESGRGNEGSWKTAYLYGMDKWEGLALVRRYGEQKNRPVCFLDFQQLAAMGRKDGEINGIKTLCLDIAMQAIFQKAWLCVYFIDSASLEKEENRQYVVWLAEFFRKQTVPCLFIGEKRCLEEIYPAGWAIGMEAGENTVKAEDWKRIAVDFPIEEDIELEVFANTYDFTFMQAERTFEQADRMRILQARKRISQRDLKESCILQTKSQGNHLVTVIDKGRPFEDLVLPERQTSQLKAACNRVRFKNLVYGKWGFGVKLSYGKGVSMVFSGPPGTGKTMSAGVVANALGTVLYQVDLAAVVSKYIGETEKNLHAVFEAVKNGHGVLFFDEADVLFSQRTQVRDAHDKHSNMEAAYLLQKMEEYDGVVILATNHIRNIDEAFKRRIQFFIEFPLPDRICRRRLWEKAFPAQVEFEERPDFAFLAERFELSGSHITNIALQAAFFAAEEGKGVKMEHIIRALMAEMEKTGRRIAYEELGEYGVYYNNI